MTDIKFISNLFNIAVNVKPKRHVNTGNTRAQDLKIINDGAIELQKLMISYDCIKAAVMLSKDKKQILKDAENFMTAEIEKLAE